MKNTNQQDRNDPHKATKLSGKEWDQTDTRLAKYGQNSEQTSGKNCQSDIVWEFRTLSGWRSLETQFSPKFCPFLPKFDSWDIGH
jgi:hypothetical protein